MPFRFLRQLVLPSLALVGLLLLAFACRHPKHTEDLTNPKPDSLRVHPEWQSHFDSCHVKGCIVIYDDALHQWMASDTTSIYRETLPASTFKIINLLIALETGVIASEQEVVKWPGSTDTLKYGFRPEIYHDMTVEEAFQVSAGWVFVELAKRIGKDRYTHYLAQCRYGNQNLSHPEDDFWNFGAFGISPMNQVEFLRRLHTGALPFAPGNMAIVRKVMITEQQGGLDIHAKTGWTREGGINTGWWVGWVERKEGACFFATRLEQDRKLNTPSFGSCRKDITRTVLRDLKVIGQ